MGEIFPMSRMVMIEVDYLITREREWVR